MWLVPWAVMAAWLGLVDFAERVVPTAAVRGATTLSVVLVATASALSGQWGFLVRGASCAALAWSSFALWAAISPKSLGFGDARMVCLVALGAGAVSPAGTFVAVSCSLLVAACWGKLRSGLPQRPWLNKASLLTRRARGLPSEQKAVALGPLLALSGIGVVVSGAF